MVRPHGRPSSPTAAMASLLTGLPIDQHGISWNTFEFSRGYPRPPTLFDYLDLGGGLDSAIFFMDESLYQLAKPAPYTDYQVCGLLRPECSPDRLVAYIRQYLKKASSGHGYGHAVLALPHLLVVHLPAPERAGTAHGWGSKEYRDALRSVDHAMRATLDLFKEHGLLAHTTIFVTALNGTEVGQAPTAGENRQPRRIRRWSRGSCRELELKVAIRFNSPFPSSTLGQQSCERWQLIPIRSGRAESSKKCSRIPLRWRLRCQPADESYDL